MSNDRFEAHQQFSIDFRFFISVDVVECHFQITGDFLLLSMGLKSADLSDHIV